MSWPRVCSTVARLGALCLACAACSLVAPGEEILSSGGCGTDEKECAGGCASKRSPDVGCAAASCEPCAFAHAAAECLAGKCHLAACELGFADCNADADDGCEVNLRADDGHCGACGKTCSVPNASATCTNGRCTVASCSTGRQDCDGDPLTICETDVTSDAQHCGSCDAGCALPGTSASACAGGSCAVAACAPGRGNCNALAADGCEVDLLASDQHCGKCSLACSSSEICTQGACRKRCPAIRALHSNARLAISSKGFGTGSGDFTVELWFARDAGEEARSAALTMNEAYSTHALRVVLGDQVVGCLVYAPGSSTAIVGGPAPVPDRWTHFACVREAGTLRLFVDGAAVASAPVDIDVLELSPTAIGTPLFGGEGTAPMKLGPLRFSKVARYKSSFTPTAAWPVDADTTAQFLVTSPFDPQSSVNLSDEAGGDNKVTNYGGFEPALSGVPCDG